MVFRLVFIVLATAFVFSCAGKKPVPIPEPRALDYIPEWSQNAVWYQIFVERFRNGDAKNDPRLVDVEGSWPHEKPASWKPAVWTSDFYAQSDWEKETGKDFYTTVHMRRYGGDFQGVLDKLDYLADMGITAIYFNPINDAPSLHKYDTRNYHHMDRNFGPDPVGDAEKMKSENPADPATWIWTAADQQFLRLIAEAHKRDIKVVVDFSWNHTGIRFWAWQDILKNGAQSAYKDWYEIERFDDPATPENEFKYSGWAGVPELPELKKIGRPEGKTHGAIAGNLIEPVKNHIFAVSKRWLDPNGDGNPADGIDGFRLDVADMVPLDFWRDYRKFVRGVNPEAYLVGEIWWEKWPDVMLDPTPWVQGDIFDAVMHYRWFKPTRGYFGTNANSVSARKYAEQLDSIATGIRPDVLRAMMNLMASHDSERFSSSLSNSNKYKFESKPHNVNAFDYYIGKPSDIALRQQKLMLVQQFTWVGSPHIWNGDEFGMWGADDPENRKPLWWSDFTFENEKSHPVMGKNRGNDVVSANLELNAYYKSLIHLRRTLPALSMGDSEILIADSASNLLVYRREDSIQTVYVAINNSPNALEFDLEIDLQIPYFLGFDSEKTPHSITDKKAPFALEQIMPANGVIPVSLNPYSAKVYYATEWHSN